MRFLADATVELLIVDQVRRAGHDVITTDAISDDEILEQAEVEERILLTCDKVISKRACRSERSLGGIVLLSFKCEDAEREGKVLAEIVRDFGFLWEGAFAVVGETQARLRRLRESDDDLTPESFDKLLNRFDPDREVAGEKYETKRKQLILFFRQRGCLHREDCADITIGRVARDIARGKEVRNLEVYFYYRAREVMRESRNNPERLGLQIDDQFQEPPLAGNIEELGQEEQKAECLEKCLQQLPGNERELIQEYYQGDDDARERNRKRLRKEFNEVPERRWFVLRYQREKPNPTYEVRKRLAERLKTTTIALTGRAFEVRKKLRQCFEECLAA